MVFSVTLNLSEFLWPSADAPAHKYVESTAIGSSPCPDRGFACGNFEIARCCGYFLDLLCKEVKAAFLCVSMHVCFSDVGLSRFWSQNRTTKHTKPQYHHETVRPRLHDGQLLTVLLLRAALKHWTYSPWFRCCLNGFEMGLSLNRLNVIWCDLVSDEISLTSKLHPALLLHGQGGHLPGPQRLTWLLLGPLVVSKRHGEHLKGPAYRWRI